MRPRTRKSVFLLKIFKYFRLFVLVRKVMPVVNVPAAVVEMVMPLPRAQAHLTFRLSAPSDPLPAHPVPLPTCSYHRTYTCFVGSRSLSEGSPACLAPHATELPVRNARVRTVSTGLSRGDPG